jgi:hypothetical protein
MQGKEVFRAARPVDIAADRQSRLVRVWELPQTNISITFVPAAVSTLVDARPADAHHPKQKTRE